MSLHLGFCNILVDDIKQVMVSGINFSGVLWASEKVKYNVKVVWLILTNHSQKAKTFTGEKDSIEENL